MSTAHKCKLTFLKVQESESLVLFSGWYSGVNPVHWFWLNKMLLTKQLIYCGQNLVNSSVRSLKKLRHPRDNLDYKRNS